MKQRYDDAQYYIDQLTDEGHYEFTLTGKFEDVVGNDADIEYSEIDDGDKRDIHPKSRDTHPKSKAHARDDNTDSEDDESDMEPIKFVPQPGDPPPINPPPPKVEIKMKMSTEDEMGRSTVSDFCVFS